MIKIQELRNKLQVSSVLAMTLEPTGFVIEQIRRKNGESFVTHSTLFPANLEQLSIDPEKYGQALREFLAAAKLREKQTILCIPPEWLMTTTMGELPEVEPEELQEYFELQAEKKFPLAPAELTFGFSEYQLSNGIWKATLASVRRKHIEALTKMLDAAGCKLESISPGLDHCISKNLPKGSASIYFQCQGKIINIVIANDGGVIALRSLSIPSASPEENVFDPKWFKQEVRITLGRLPQGTATDVVEAMFSSTQPFSESMFQQLKGELQGLGIKKVGFTKASTALPTANAFLQRQPVAFEFLASEASQFGSVVRWFESGHRRWYLLSGLIFLFLPLTIFALQSHEENQLLAEWNGMKSAVDQLEQLQGKLRQFRGWYEPTSPSVRIMDALVNIFPDRGDVWAKQINIKNNSKVTCEGFAKRQPAMLEFLDRLRNRPEVSELQVQQIRGDNPIQFSFTFVWRQKDES